MFEIKHISRDQYVKVDMSHGRVLHLWPQGSDSWKRSRFIDKATMVRGEDGRADSVNLASNIKAGDMIMFHEIHNGLSTTSASVPEPIVVVELPIFLFPNTRDPVFSMIRVKCNELITIISVEDAKWLTSSGPVSYISFPIKTKLLFPTTSQIIEALL